MKRFKVFIAAIVSLGFLQSCGTMEITQSRYGNGIGIAFDNANGVDEQNAAHFRARKSDEANHKKWMQQGVAMHPRQGVFKTAPSLEIDGQLPVAVTAEEENTSAAPSTDIMAAMPQTFVAEKTVMGFNQPIDANSNAALPNDEQKTTSTTTNLGYLGGILILVGLALFIIGYPTAITLVALGVLLVVVAYFLG